MVAADRSARGGAGILVVVVSRRRHIHCAYSQDATGERYKVDASSDCISWIVPQSRRVIRKGCPHASSFSWVGALIVVAASLHRCGLRTNPSKSNNSIAAGAAIAVHCIILNFKGGGIGCLEIVERENALGIVGSCVEDGVCVDSSERIGRPSCRAESNGAPGIDNEIVGKINSRRDESGHILTAGLEKAP